MQVVVMALTWLGYWWTNAGVGTPKPSISSTLSLFSFKTSVPCSDAPMDPQLQVGAARQVLALDQYNRTTGYRSISHSSQCSEDEDTWSDGD